MSGSDVDSDEAERLRLAALAADGALDGDTRATSAGKFGENLKRLSGLAEMFGRVGARGAADAADAADVADVADVADAVAVRGEWGHLRIGRRIGKGAFGDVFVAYDTVLHREVSLKLQRVDAAAMDAAGYIDEARRLARVRDPHVLAIHGADVHQGRVGLWADLLSGVTLEARMAAEPRLDRDSVAAIAGQMGAALVAVNAAGLCHGDLKPANIMCEPGGRYVLMDFGAARDHRETGTTCYGTPRFMAPERLLLESSATAEDDIYALGVILHRAATAQYPGGADSLDSLLDWHRSGSRVDALPLRRALGRPLADLVLQMLHADPAARPTATQLVERCRMIAGLPRRRRQRQAVGAVIASLLLGLVAALVGYQSAVDARLREASERRRAEQVSQLLMSWLAAPQRVERGSGVRVIDVIGDAARALELNPPDDPGVESQLRFALGRTLAGVGDRALARQQFERMLALASRAPAGDRDAAVATREAQYGIALIERENGDFDAAMARLQALLQTIEAAVDDSGEMHAVVLAGLADGLLVTSDFAGAGVMLDRAERVLADVDPAVRDAEAGLVEEARMEWLLAQGDFAAVVDRAAAVLARIRGLHGERNEAALIAWLQLVEALAGAGRLADAEREARTLVASSTDWLGSDDRFVSAAAVALANILDDLGRHAEALPLRREALARARSRADATDSDRVAALSSLGNTLKEIGQRDEAIGLYREAIDLADARLGERHQFALTTRSNLAEALLEAGDFIAAQAAARDAAVRMRANLGDDHPFVAHASGVLGAALRGAGDDAAGQAELLAAARLAERTVGVDHPLALDIDWYRFGPAGETAAGERAPLQALLARQRDALGASHPDTLRTERQLARMSR